MEVMDKDKIETYILPCLSKGKRGPSHPEPWRVVGAILYRLKTGCQWRMLPVSCFFEPDKVVGWQTIYHYFNKWAKDGSFTAMWTKLLQQGRNHIDMSCIQLDGSLSLAKRGGQAVGYQGRKKGKATNMLFLCDSNGLPLSVSEPEKGSHHDTFDITGHFGELCTTLKDADISLNGVFMNADSGFDTKELRLQCSELGIEANIDRNKRNSSGQEGEYVYFDPKLYEGRYVIERMNAWIDTFKTLLVRFETLSATWKALHLMAFAVLIIRKL